ncbi:MAG: stage 0 sporulation family protein [Oscillospiraceae bacterium]|nr:stage 0 sporulation family protein [Oscillospiraceae bacterium]
MKTVKIVGVKFRGAGKVYHFSPGGLLLRNGDSVIVETARGLEMGTVVLVNNAFETARVLKHIVRIASDKDKMLAEKNRNREKEIFDTFVAKIEEHKLKMKAISVDCTFDGSKILFYFTADSRVDFRELVKDLAGVFRTRIELRQIGVRDEAKLLGGLGICGRGFCCATFLGDFQPVSIKMAKEQSLSLNPTKISGTCGRLMCCLKYEQDCYEELIKTTPGVGSLVETKDGRGFVQDANLLTGMLKIKLQKNENDAPPVSFKKEDVKLIRAGQVRVSKEEAAALKALERQ